MSLDKIEKLVRLVKFRYISLTVEKIAIYNRRVFQVLREVCFILNYTEFIKMLIN